jgi:hypothetical protein
MSQIKEGAFLTVQAGEVRNTMTIGMNGWRTRAYQIK